MSPPPLEQLTSAIVSYSSGLDAQLELLTNLEAISARQAEATRDGSAEALAQCSDERARLTAALIALEQNLKPVRALLADHSHLAARLPGFASLVTRHSAAGRRIAALIEADSQIMAALKDADAARRFAAQALEAGEATLAAYRRVIAPPPTSAAIVDERG